MDKKELKTNLYTLLLLCLGTAILLSWVALSTPDERIPITMTDLPEIHSQHDMKDTAQKKAAPSYDMRAAMKDTASKPKVALPSPEQFGMRKQLLAKHQYGLSVPLVVQWRFSCGVAEREQINKYLEKANIDSVLLSIEPLTTKNTDFPPVTQLLPKDTFLEDVRAVLTIPPTKQAVHLGLFICTDSSNEGNCRSKEPYKRPTTETSAQTEPLSRDRTFYFSYLILADRELYALDYRLRGSMYPKLEEYLNQSIVQAGAASNLLSSIRTLNNELQSFQLVMRRPEIRLTLPVAHKGCSQ